MTTALPILLLIKLAFQVSASAACFKLAHDIYKDGNKGFWHFWFAGSGFALFCLFVVDAQELLVRLGLQ